MSTALDPEQQRAAVITELSRLVDDWRASIADSIGTSEIVTEAAQQRRVLETVQRAVALDGELHDADLPPEWVAEFRGILFSGIRSLQNKDAADAYDDLMLDAEAIRHMLRDALDGHVVGAEDDVSMMMEQLRTWLPRVSQRELADVLGVSTRQLQRWTTSHARPTRRAQLVARLVALLRHAWTPEGVIAWFHRPRPQLDERAPIELLDDPEYESTLLVTVRQGRAQHGS